MMEGFGSPDMNPGMQAMMMQKIFGIEIGEEIVWQEAQVIGTPIGESRSEHWGVVGLRLYKPSLLVPKASLRLSQNTVIDLTPEDVGTLAASMGEWAKAAEEPYKVAVEEGASYDVMKMLGGVTG